MSSYASRESTRVALQARLDATKSRVGRNKLGQFATPHPLAREMLTHALRWMPDGPPVRFLDPAFGTGPFYSALLQRAPGVCVDHAVGYEVDHEYASAARHVWHDAPLTVREEDFT